MKDSVDSDKDTIYSTNSDEINLENDRLLVSYTSVWLGSNFGFLCSIIFLEIFLKVYTILV